MKINKQKTQNSMSQNEVDVESLRENRKDFIKSNKLILKSLQRFRSKKHNVFTEEASQIALRTNNNKRIQSVNSIETCEYGASKDLVCKEEEIKGKNIIKQ